MGTKATSAQTELPPSAVGYILYLARLSAGGFSLRGRRLPHALVAPGIVSRLRMQWVLNIYPALTVMSTKGFGDKRKTVWGST